MDQQSHEVQLRKMERPDLETVLGLINKEGWDYHISELERILKIDPENSIVACSGDLIVGGTTVAVAGDRCILGHVVVREGWRNKGIGKRMMEHLERKMDSSGIRTMEAYALEAAFPFYRRQGYRVIEEIDTYEKILAKGGISGSHNGGKVRTLGRDDLGEICRLDKLVTRFDRPRILGQLMDDFPRMSKGLFEGEELTGFILARENPVMNDIGPWVMAKPDVGNGAMMLRSILGELRPGIRAIMGFSMNNRVSREILLGADFKHFNRQLRAVRCQGEADPFTPGTMSLSAFEFG